MHLKPQAAVLFGAVFLAVSGCGPDAADIPAGMDESATGESSLNSYPGLTEGSTDAIGVLKLANEASLPQLTQTAGVGLVSRTAKAIVAWRAGPDGIEATADDQRFTTLAQLFAVKYVGTVSVQHLLAYARAHGYVPPAPPVDDPMPTCAGSPTGAEVVFTTGTQTTFTRTCDAAGACSAWKQASIQGVHEDNGPRSLLLTATGVYVEAQIGPGYTIEGGGTYDCSNYDWGSGNIDPLTGVGTGQLGDGYRCNISGGSGGPGGQNAHRPVAIKAGASCVAITDVVSPSQGAQRLRVMVLRP